MKPEDWRRKADELDAEADRRIKAGDILGGVPLGVQAERYRDAAGKLEQALTVGSQTGKNKAMQSVARLHISQGRAEDDPLQVAVNEAGHTMRSLEKQLRDEGYRCSRQFLMQCRRGDANIREPLAERIQELLGKHPRGHKHAGQWRFAATRANWPGNAWAKEPTEG